jgi:uncharacterized protein with FMN-binding domain
MKRAPIVFAGTAVGLAGVLSFHSTPIKVNLGGLAGGSTATTSPSSATTIPAGSSPPTTTRTKATTTASKVVTPTTTRTTPTTVHTSTPTTVRSTTSMATTTTIAPTTTVATTTKTATGPVVNYFYGTVSVSITASGKKISKVTIASLNDGGNSRSQYIDQQSLPMLIQQAMAAQSANIQGVSGASYTSAGFDQSLLGALKQLGLA